MGRAEMGDGPSFEGFVQWRDNRCCFLKVLLKGQFFWDIALRHWMSLSRRFE
jgi:hypothetical protein